MLIRCTRYAQCNYSACWLYGVHLVVCCCALLLLAGGIGHLCAQSLPVPEVFLPEHGTNRRLGYISDASAVAWNPALMGVRQSLDLTLMTPLTTQFSTTQPLQFGMFGKFSGLGLGYTGSPADGATALFAGIGIPVVDDWLWLGASGRLFNKGELSKISLNSLRYNLAAVAHPMKGLFVGLSATTMSALQNEDALFVNLDAAYSPTSWATIFAQYSSYGGAFSSQAPGANTPFTQLALGGLELGASVGILNDMVLLSGRYNVSRNSARLAAELNLWRLTVGMVGESGLGAFPQGYTAFVHLGTDVVRNVAQLHTSRADDDGCREPVDTLFDKPEYLLAKVKADNPELYAELEPLAAPNPKNLYNAIQSRYYTPPNNNAVSLSGDTIAVISRQNYALELINVNNSNYPLTSVVVRARNAEGKTVSGLGIHDFTLRDPKFQLVSVVPTTSLTPVPVDIVMLIDCSGSMQNKINETRNNARAFVETIKQRGADARIGGILYGMSVVDALEPTANFEKFEAFISKARATEPDEYAPDALRMLAEMPFRPHAQKIAVLITDEVTFWGAAMKTVERDIVQLLWSKGIALSSIVNLCDNNASYLARLTMGREYNIKEPFTAVLDNLGKDLTTTYTITYQKMLPPKALTVVRGKVQDEFGKPLAAEILLTDNNANTVGPALTDANGNFARMVVEGRKYTVSVNATEPNKYLPLTTDIDLSFASKGDTITLPQPLVLRQVTFLRGTVRDERGTPLSVELSLSEEGKTTLVASGEPLVSEDSTGAYFVQITEGRRYNVFVNPFLRDRDKYLPLRTKLDLTAVQKGDTAVRDFVLRLNPKDVVIAGEITATQPVARPLQGVTVTAKDVAAQKTIAQTTSDAQGKYALTIPKNREVLLSAETGDYYADSLRLTIAKRDTISTLRRNLRLVWKNVVVTGRVRAAKNAQVVVEAEVTAQDSASQRALLQTVTDADGNYRLTVPKERGVQIVGQSSQYFFDAFDLNVRKYDTATIVRDLWLPEQLTLRINFPTDQYNNPTPYILDSNAAMTTTTWQSEVERVAKNLLLFKSFIAKLIVVGHTDDAAAEDYNMRLGQRRAEFVRDELIKCGVPPEMLEARSKGENEFLLRRPNETVEQYRARCRRVELIKLLR